MGSIKEYFTSLGSGVASLVKGMTVTGKEFVTPKITERYPARHIIPHHVSVPYSNLSTMTKAITNA